MKGIKQQECKHITDEWIPAHGNSCKRSKGNERRAMRQEKASSPEPEELVK
jgi:hypothetical protein